MKSLRSANAVFFILLSFLNCNSALGADRCSMCQSERAQLCQKECIGSSQPAALCQRDCQIGGCSTACGAAVSTKTAKPSTGPGAILNQPMPNVWTAPKNQVGTPNKSAPRNTGSKRF